MSHHIVILETVQAHPNCMSPVLLEHLLRGEIIGRMEEKGLLDSHYLGKLKAEAPGRVAALIEECLDTAVIQRAGGFYPALSLTEAGKSLLAANKPKEPVQ